MEYAVWTGGAGLEARFYGITERQEYEIPDLNQGDAAEWLQRFDWERWMPMVLMLAEKNMRGKPVMARNTDALTKSAHSLTISQCLTRRAGCFAGLRMGLNDKRCYKTQLIEFNKRRDRNNFPFFKFAIVDYRQWNCWHCLHNAMLRSEDGCLRIVGNNKPNACLCGICPGFAVAAWNTCVIYFKLK